MEGRKGGIKSKAKLAKKKKNKGSKRYHWTFDWTWHSDLNKTFKVTIVTKV